MRTLVYFGPSGIGDWMFILPSLQSLLRATGCDRVVAVLPRRNEGNRILERSPLIHRIDYLDRPDHWWQLPRYLLRVPLLVSRLRRLRADAAAVSYLSNQPDTLLLAWMSGISRRIGLRSRGTLLERLALNVPVRPAGAEGKVALHARFADGAIGPLTPVSLLQSTSPEASRIARGKHGIPEKYVVLGIGGGRNARWRFWPAENFAALMAAMPDIHFVMLGGGRDDRSAADAILAARSLENVIDLVDRVAFDESLHVLAAAFACVGNDSGLANLAAAHGVPTICLYGPTDPRLTGPALLGAMPLRVSVPCGPCFDESQQATTARRCADRICLSGVDVQRTASALRNLLEKTR